MKILIVDSYYNAFLRSVYERNRGLAQQPYCQQWQTLMGYCFGIANFYSTNFGKLGCDASEVVYNCAPLQRQWAREHGLALGWHLPRVGRRSVHGLPFPALYPPRPDWLEKVLVAQVAAMRPDVLFFNDIFLLEALFTRVRPLVRLIVGQHASPLNPSRSLAGFDLVLSSLPNFVEHFRSQGLNAEYLRLGFESSLLTRLPARPDLCYDVVHVGGYGRVHAERNALLEALAREVNVDFWGYDVESLPPDSPIRQNYRGQAFGLEMYRVRQASRIVVSKHINAVAGPWANIMTLYEATGVGSCLLIDERQDLDRIFEPDREVVTYGGPAECIEKARYLLAHESERAAIAQRGQQRTLAEHTYLHRAQEMLAIFRRYLGEVQREQPLR